MSTNRFFQLRDELRRFKHTDSSTRSKSSSVSTAQPLSRGLIEQLTKRHWIMPGDGFNDENFAFNPNSNDLSIKNSGRINIEVKIRDMPKDAKVVWTIPSKPPGNQGIVTLLAPGSPDLTTINHKHTGLSVDVLGIKPGVTYLDITLVDGKGKSLESLKRALSVPQFFTVSEHADFQDVMDKLNMPDAADKGAILTSISTIAPAIIPEANVRFIWTMPPLNQSLPAQFNAGNVAAGNVGTITFRGDPPGGRRLFGNTAGGGPTVFNSTIDLFPNTFLRSDLRTQNLDEMTGLLIDLISTEPTDATTPEKVFAQSVIARIFAENMVHEAVHSLLGNLVGPRGHNPPGTMKHALMNRGIERPLASRSGITVDPSLFATDPTNPVTLANIASKVVDGGVAGINRLKGKALNLVNYHFPVPGRAREFRLGRVPSGTTLPPPSP